MGGMFTFVSGFFGFPLVVVYPFFVAWVFGIWSWGWDRMVTFGCAHSGFASAVVSFLFGPWWLHRRSVGVPSSFVVSLVCLFSTALSRQLHSVYPLPFETPATFLPKTSSETMLETKE